MSNLDKYDHWDDTGDTGFPEDTTPAPFMLLFSTSLLFYGILGIRQFILLNKNFQNISF